MALNQLIVKKSIAQENCRSILIIVDPMLVFVYNGIVFSGESGSGKTEAARIILQFLVLVSSDSKQVKIIKNRFVHASTVLEAFGNAKTMRNDNASRFVSIIWYQ